MDPDPLNGATRNPRKVKFKPKAPPKRVQKLLKVEKYEDDVDEAKAEHLLRRFNETSSKERPKFEKKAAATQVAFGYGGSSRAFLKSYGPAKGLKNEAASSDGVAGQRMEKEYKEPWDYYTNYPVTLPVRRPYAGNPERLDEEEFGEKSVRSESEENATNAAQELGLLDEDQDNMFFLQLPPMLPAIEQSDDLQVPAVPGPENRANPSKGPVKSQKFCKLESLPEGLIGKMLVYKSGAVKLKIGETLYDVSPGLKCTFAQDVVAINAEKKHCCNFGELSKRAVAIPDIDSMLQSLSEL